jgi:hypothetical protein
MSSPLALPKLHGQRSLYSHQSSGTNIHKANKQAYEEQITNQKKTLKERTKG